MGGTFAVIIKGNLVYCIDSILEVGNQSNLLDSCISKAAYYIHCISLAHGLLDYNKRTAYQTAEVFLRANGYKLMVTEPDEVVDMLRQISTRKVTINYVEEWVRKHIKPFCP